MHKHFKGSNLYLFEIIEGLKTINLDVELKQNKTPSETPNEGRLYQKDLFGRHDKLTLTDD